MTEETVLDTRSEEFLPAVKALFKTDNDEAAIYYLEGMSAQRLKEELGTEIPNWTVEHLHQIIATTIEKFGGGDGVELSRGIENPLWLAVTLAVENKLPSQQPTDRRWIRLDTITSVYAKSSMSVGDDVRDWLFSLTVQVGETIYHASPVRFRGEMANRAVDKILDAVTAALAK
jgi:hypothetical protein